MDSTGQRENCDKNSLQAKSYDRSRFIQYKDASVQSKVASYTKVVNIRCMYLMKGKERYTQRKEND